MPYSYKLNVFLTQTGVVLFLKVANSPAPRDGQIPPWGRIPPRLGTTDLESHKKKKIVTVRYFNTESSLPYL